jgi:hypothetical protein
MLWREENKRGWLFNERNTISDVVDAIDDDDVSVIEVYSFCDWSKCVIDW